MVKSQCGNGKEKATQQFHLEINNLHIETKKNLWTL